MFQMDWGNWPIRTGAAVPPAQLRGGVAPLRHDLAVATYVEKQAALRTAAAADRLGVAQAGGVIMGARLACSRLLLAFASRRPGSRIA